MGAMRVLLVEDEPKMAALLARGLREEGHAADVAVRGEEALWMAQGAPYDAIVLDVMLPGLDGFATCRQLRADGVWAPVLMLTARDAVEDRVEGLDAGADDYLLKPFSFAELLARLRALVRRAPAERPTLLEVGDLRLDPAARRAWRGETELELSAKEFALLEVFMRRPGEALSRRAAARGRLGHGLREPLERHRRVRALPAREDRPAVRPRLDRDDPRRRLPPARGRRLREPAADPGPAHAAVRGRDGGRARGAGLFIYVRVGGALLDSVDQSLRGQAQEASGPRRARPQPARPRQRGRPDRRAARERAAASVVQSTPRTLGPILAGEAARRARSPASTVWRSGSIAGLENDWRILAVPAQVGGGRGALVVAQSLEPREEALHRLVREFLLGGPVALLLAILAGYARRGRRAAAGRGDAPARGRDRRLDAREAPAGAAGPRRALAARRDAQRHARPARSRRSSTSGASSPTRATSCARRSRC